MIDFLTVKEVGEKWNVSGRIILISAVKPIDGRTRTGKNERTTFSRKIQ